jgi:hypothetical protein
MLDLLTLFFEPDEAAFRISKQFDLCRCLKALNS